MIQGMPRVRLAWLVAISLMSAGSLAAHSLAYCLVEPDGQGRAALLESTGHGYLSAAPALLALSLAIGIAALAGLAIGGSRGRSRVTLVWQLAMLPLLGFALQEHLERLLSGGPLVGAALEPTFLVGLALEVPFAIMALVVARILTRAAVFLGSTLPSPSRPRLRAALSIVPHGLDVSLPRVAALALGPSSRGPPSHSRP